MKRRIVIEGCTDCPYRKSRACHGNSLNLWEYYCDQAYEVIDCEIATSYGFPDFCPLEEE